MNPDIDRTPVDSGHEPEEYHLEGGDDGVFGNEPPPVDDLFQSILDEGPNPQDCAQGDHDRFLSVGLGFYERLKEMG